MTDSNFPYKALEKALKKLNVGEVYAWPYTIRIYPNPPLTFDMVERRAKKIVVEIKNHFEEELSINIEYGNMLPGYLGGVSDAPQFSEADVVFTIKRES